MGKQLSAEELIAQGLVSVLKLEPDKKYILFLKRHAFSDETCQSLAIAIGQIHVGNVVVRFNDDEGASAQDVVKAVEV